MCDCIANLENQAKEKMGEQLPNIQRAGFIHKSWMVTGPVQGTVLSQPIEIDYVSTTKKGKEQTKTRIINIVPSYCPFCGENLEKVGGEGAA